MSCAGGISSGSFDFLPGGGPAGGGTQSALKCFLNIFASNVPKSFHSHTIMELRTWTGVFAANFQVSSFWNSKASFDCVGWRFSQVFSRSLTRTSERQCKRSPVTLALLMLQYRFASSDTPGTLADPDRAMVAPNCTDAGIRNTHAILICRK